MSAYQAQQHSQVPKILMLHGTGQSGDIHCIKTRFLHGPLNDAFGFAGKSGFHSFSPDGVQLDFPNGPIPSPCAEDVPSMNWDNTPSEDAVDRSLERIETFNWGYGDWPNLKTIGVQQSVLKILQILNENGPYIGIIGFSSGASTGIMAAALLEGDKHVQGLSFENRHPPLDFVVSFSGYTLRHPEFRPVYSQGIRTPVLEFYGDLDTILDKSHAEELIDACPSLEFHLFHGSHFIPRGQEVADKIVEFIFSSLGWSESSCSDSTSSESMSESNDWESMSDCDTSITTSENDEVKG